MTAGPLAFQQEHTLWLWDMYGIFMGYLWDIHGISLGYLWDITGIFPCGYVKIAMENGHRKSLVGGLEHLLCFHILGIIIPIEKYFSEGFKPPTRQ